jgi:hypothetical protein
MSVRIRLHEHPLAPVAPREFAAPSVGHWLLEHYGDAPQVAVQVYRGEPSGATEVTRDLAVLLSEEPADYVVLQSPGAALTAWQILQIVIAVYSVASALMASTSQPANVNRTSASPNNSLGERNNQVRLLQRIEDIYGTVRAVPSLLMPTYNKYIAHRKVEYGYYCVGRGYYSITSLRDADTLLADIPNASAAVYGPFTSPNSGDAPQLLIGAPIIDKILTVRRSEEVDGITLKALNQLQLRRDAQYAFEAHEGGDVIKQRGAFFDDRKPNFNAIVSVGDEIDISDVQLASVTAEVTSGEDGFAGDFAPSEGGDGGENIFRDARVGDSLIVQSDSAPGMDGAYTIVSISDTLLSVTPAPPVVSLPATAKFTVRDLFAGRRTVTGVGDGLIELAGSVFDRSFYSLATIDVVQSLPVSDWSPWITLPDADRTEIFINVVAPQGMYKDDGGRSVATVVYEAQIERLNPSTLAPTGQVEVVSGDISGSVQEERAETLEHVTAWVGPARVRMRRVTQYDYGFEGTIVDEIKFADLYAVTPVDKAEFGNLTTIHTITQATTRATAIKTRQLNCLASRLIPAWTGSGFTGALAADGRLASGTLQATSRIVDIIAALALDPKIGHRSLAELDMAQMWGVQQQLDAWRPECGQFNYTFDADNLSFEESVQMVANAGFCRAYRQSGRIRLSLDRPQAYSAMQFTHRNKDPEPGAETITRTFANDGDFDGVDFVYSDPDTEASETIRLPLDGSALSPKKFELPGIRNFTQAWLRAWREWLRLQHQRITIETRCTTDARALIPGRRVDCVDNTTFAAQDGEVVAQQGLLLTLSQRVTFAPGVPHSLVLSQRNGALQGIPCTPGPDPRQVVLAYAPAEAIVTDLGPDGIRTIYSFGPDDARGAMAYQVTEIDPPDGGYVTWRGVNYAPTIYGMDDQPVPDKAAIINS